MVAAGEWCTLVPALALELSARSRIFGALGQAETDRRVVRRRKDGLTTLCHRLAPLHTLGLQMSWGELPVDEKAIDQDMLIDGFQHVQPNDVRFIASA